MILLTHRPREEIVNWSFDLIRVIADENARQADIASGRIGNWDPDAIPSYKDPEGPPAKAHFVSYGMGLGLTSEMAEKMYEEQVAAGGGFPHHLFTDRR